jgi:hypothetical protein
MFHNANQCRCHHNYQPGDKCLALDPTATSKLHTWYLGPFQIVNTRINGTVTFQCTPHVMDCLNIWQICGGVPFRRGRVQCCIVDTTLVLSQNNYVSSWSTTFLLIFYN